MTSKFWTSKDEELKVQRKKDSGWTKDEIKDKTIKKSKSINVQSRAYKVVISTLIKVEAENKDEQHVWSH